jgi:protein-S-isoprenylcysteine O-methyltransferase Ste14
MPSSVDHAQVPVQPPLIFFGYLVSALALHWAVPFPLPASVWLRVLGAVVTVLGLALGFSAVGAMRRAGTTLNPHAAVSTLVTGGPYRFTRNPIYLSFLLLLLGLTVAAGTWWGVLVSPFMAGTLTHWVIHPEEAYLESKFDDEYRAYLSRVRQWI